MKIKWQKLIFKICFWLLTEAVFNLIGIDDLVDYSEFISMPKANQKLEYYIAV